MPQCGQVFLGKAVCLLAGLVEVCTARVGAWQIAQIGGAVLGGSITGTNDASVASLASVYGNNRLGGILFAMVGDVHAYRRLGCTHDQLRRGRALADEDLGDSTILPKVVIAAKRRYELIIWRRTKGQGRECVVSRWGEIDWWDDRDNSPLLWLVLNSSRQRIQDSSGQLACWQDACDSWLLAPSFRALFAF